MTDVVTNTKAGWCSMCRSDMHSLCASAVCTCPDMRRHRQRPGFGSVTPIDQNRKANRSARPPQAKEATVADTPVQAEPIIELVAEDPPEKPTKTTVIDQVVALIQQPGLVRGKLYRVAVMPTTRAAGVLATRLSKHEVTKRMVLEWRRHDDKVYVRGPK